MKFGAVAPQEALGATAVHTIRQDGLVLKKGTLIGAAEVAALEAAGIADIVVARLEPGDVSEDVAAAEIAKAVAGEGVHVDRAFTGRANLFAQDAGVLVVDKDAIDRLNRVDEAITFATLPAYKPVVAGEMIATVKIIPFAVAEARARCGARGRRQAAPARRALSHPQGRRGVDAAARPGAQGDRKDAEDHGRTARARRRHDRRRAARAARARGARRALEEVLKAGAELVIVFGASAIADRRDVIPAALEAIGGRIEHFGMPVDPGNLLMIGDAGRPSGARRAGLRPQPEGKRIRLGADAACSPVLPVPREDITGLGVGGLLMEIVTRPQPRNEPVPRSRPHHRRDRAWRRPLEPHGRPEQAAGGDRRPAAGAHRGRAGAGVARAAGDRRHRPSARAGRSGARGTAGARSCTIRISPMASAPRSRPASPRCRRRPTAPSSASATCRRSMPR